MARRVSLRSAETQKGSDESISSDGREVAENKDFREEELRGTSRRLGLGMVQQCFHIDSKVHSSKLQRQSRQYSSKTEISSKGIVPIGTSLVVGF